MFDYWIGIKCPYPFFLIDGIHDLEDRDSFDNLEIVKNYQIENVIKNNSRHTTRDITEILRISHIICEYVKHYDVLVYQDFKEKITGQ